MAGVIDRPVFPLGLPEPNRRLLGTGLSETVSLGSGVVAARIALGGSALTVTPSLGSGSVAVGPVSLVGTGLSDPVTFGDGRISFQQFLAGTGLSDTVDFGTGSMVLGGYTILDDETDDFPPAFGLGSVTVGPVSLSGSNDAFPVTFGSGTVAPGPVSLIGYGIPRETRLGLGSIRPLYIYFVGPKLTYGHGRRNSPLWWVEQRDGITLLKQSGVWTEVMYPTGDEIAAAEKAFRGGYRTPITGTEKAELVAAGYGSYIEEE